jgi:hypothetical protein
VNELVLGVNMALGRDAASHCSALDGDQSGTVEINDLLNAVGSALHGCL